MLCCQHIARRIPLCCIHAVQSLISTPRMYTKPLSHCPQGLQHDPPHPQKQQGSGPSAAPGGGTIPTGGLTGGQRGYLRCLLHMGHLQGMMTQVDGWACSSSGTMQQHWSHTTVLKASTDRGMADAVPSATPPPCSLLALRDSLGWPRAVKEL